MQSSDLNFLNIVVGKVFSYHAIFNARKYLTSTNSNFTDYFYFFKTFLTYSLFFLCLQVVQHQSLQKCLDYLAWMFITVIRPLSGSCQAVIRQPSGSQQPVIMQSSGSQQAVIRQLLDSHSCSVFLVSCC